MAKKGNRKAVGLACEKCKSRNYVTSKNTMITKDKLSLSKYCKKCRATSTHLEYKSLH